MPYISTEALVGAGLLVVLAVGYQFMPTGSGSGSANSKKNKKNKKKTKSATTGNEQQVVSVPLPPAPAATSKAAANGLKQNKPAKESTSAKPADKAESTVQPAQPAPAKPKTLAEKIAPQPRKSKVDDMLAPEDLPATHARVMRVVDPSKKDTPKSAPKSSKSATSKPATPASPTISKKAEDEKSSRFVEDFASSDESSGAGGVEDDGWNVVAAKPKKPVTLSLSQSVASAPTSTALPVSTKIQKKNAKKSEAKKEAKAVEEADRQRRLAMHRRDLERERINELYTTSSKKPTAQAGGRTTAGASVDSNGKLIWD